MKNIAVATDYSEVSKNAVYYAANLALALNAKLYIIHVYETPVFFTSEMPYTAVEAAEKLAQSEGESKMKDLSKEVKAEFPNLNFIEVVKRGLTAELVCDLAAEYQAELLVSGSTGAGMIERTLIGSTTTSIINNSKIPTLIIPENSRYTTISKIVFTTDLNDENIKEAANLIPFAKLMDAEIAFLFVDNTILADSEEFSKVMTEKIHGNVSYQKVSGYICTDPNITNGITLFLHENNADMVCMLTRKRKFPFMLWDKSITTKFSYHTDVPLMILHTT
jgi:nucleotide-binding universal stress UspA family protein